MSAFLTDRASLKRELFRVMNTDAADGASTEHDDAAVVLEGLYMLLQQGAEDAQEWLIGAGLGSLWLSTSAVLTWTQETDGQYYTALPADFLRLYGDQETSGLRDAAGIRWGQEIPPEMQWRATYVDCYFISNQRLYLVQGASPKSDLVMDYYRRIGTLADGSTVDLPEQDRALIVAFAALHAREQAWYTGGPEGDAKLERNLRSRKQMAWRRGRRSRTTRQVQAGMTSDHWFI